jgi:hypothetical protein
MTDKEKVVLSVAGGLSTVAIGYLVWRHEHAVTQQDNAAQLAATQQSNDEYAQQLEAALTTQFAVGGGASGSEYDTGTVANVTPAAQDSNIAAILQAFFGSNQTTTNPIDGSTTTPPTPQPTPAQPSTTTSGFNPSPVGPEPITTPRSGSGTNSSANPVTPTGTSQPPISVRPIGPIRVTTNPVAIS